MYIFILLLSVANHQKSRYSEAGIVTLYTPCAAAPDSEMKADVTKEDEDAVPIGFNKLFYWQVLYKPFTAACWSD